MPRKSAAAHNAAREQRRAKVADLLVTGASNRRIAQALKHDKKTIDQDVKALLAQWAKDQNPEDRDRYRVKQIAEISEIKPAFFARARAGDEKAAKVLRDIWEHEARLTGAYAPVRTEVTGKNGGPIELQTFADLARAAAGEDVFQSRVYRGNTGALPRQCTEDPRPE